MYRLRAYFGWDASYVAQLASVTPRTVGLWETGEQVIPDGRWRLFMHEVRREIDEAQECGQQLVVVLADDGVSPIDAVSDRNYVSFERKGDIGYIASFAIDRITKQPTIHQQRFKCSVNRHVVEAAEHWEATRLATAHGPDAAMLATLRWMTRRTLAAEQANPRLRELKDAVASATREVDAASKGPEALLREKLRAQDEAIYQLMEAVENSARR